MTHPAPDATKLLQAWMEWERGDTPPGRVMSNLKTGGLRILLEELSAATPIPLSEEELPGTVSADSWTPVV
jgi:hypothetical protein